MNRFKQSLLLLSSISLLACGGDTQPTDDDAFFVPPIQGDVSEDIFDRERLIQVALKMPALDFARLRSEGRPLDVSLSGCSEDFEYTDFKALANIDGVELENVAIRKKGYLGSLSRIRPSIKLNFDTHQEGRRFKTLKRMTLNNNRQDPSHSRQCLAYDLYQAAGLVAPRCNLARVMINNEDLGIYTHVESIKKPFLERNYSNKGGNLYEAQVADFGSELIERFELKTNKTANNRSDLEQLTQVLELSDEEFLTQLPRHIDLQEFITFWAVESLIGHWDSATGNNNNYYIYHNPDDDLFHFIPWGTDSAFHVDKLLKPNSGPLFKNLSLAKRLFDIDSTRQQYFAAINNLLSEQWNEEALLAKLIKVQQLTAISNEENQAIKDFIQGNENNNQESQRQILNQAMAGELPHTSYLLPNTKIDCNPNNKTQLSADFESDEDGDEGSFSFIDENGEEKTASMTIVSSFTDKDSLAYVKDTSTSPNVIGLTFIGAANAPFYNESYVLQVFVEKDDYQEGEVNLQGFATNLMLFKVLDKDAIPPKLQLISTGHTGLIELDEAGIGTKESPISGSIEAQMGAINPPNYLLTEY